MSIHATGVVRLIRGQGARLLGLGVLVGVVLWFALARVLETLLFGVHANDPSTRAGVRPGSRQRPGGALHARGSAVGDRADRRLKDELRETATEKLEAAKRVAAVARQAARDAVQRQGVTDLPKERAALAGQPVL